MKKFQQTRLSELATGYRFYFKKKKNKLYTFIETKAVGVLGGREYVYLGDGDLYKTTGKKDKACIFLRHEFDN